MPSPAASLKLLGEGQRAPLGEDGRGRILLVLFVSGSGFNVQGGDGGRGKGVEVSCREGIERSSARAAVRGGVCEEERCVGW